MPLSAGTALGAGRRAAGPLSTSRPMRSRITSLGPAAIVAARASRWARATSDSSR